VKIIVTYASAGAGHLKAAEAVFNYLKENFPDADLKIVDALDKTNLLFKYNYTWGYSFLVRHLLFIWHLAFWATSFKPIQGISRKIASWVNRLNSLHFADFLIREDADWVISTHFLPSDITAQLKNPSQIKSSLMTIITDFGVHPYWISKGTDIYIVASRLTKQKLHLESVEDERIKEFGIPVDERFLKSYDRDELCKKLKVDKNKFTVLIMTGSFGIGPVEEIVEALYKEAQILVVCAKNKKLFVNLTKKKFENTKVFGFIDNAAELMAVSDVIITKPGGLSIAEIFNMELVPVFISPIPGQEAANIQVLKEYRIGLSPKNIGDLKNIILDFKNNPYKLIAIKNNIKKIRKPDTLKEIGNVIRQSRARPAY
jgi:processive 1,2-diacylglycerol beta-glucosyltransferase